MAARAGPPASPFLALFRELAAAGAGHCLLWSGGRFGGLDASADTAVVLIPGETLAHEQAFTAAGFRPLRKRFAGPRTEYVALAGGPDRLVKLEIWSALSAADPLDIRNALPWERRLLSSAVPVPDVAGLAAPDPTLGDLLLALWASHPSAPSARARRELLRRRPAGLGSRARELLAELAGDEASRNLGKGALDERVHAALPVSVVKPDAAAGAPFTPGRGDDSGRSALLRGASVAFVGSDGAGKSSSTKDFLSFASETLETEFVYLGSGEGPSSWFRWPMLMVARLLQRLRPAKESGASGGSTPGKPSLRRRFRPVWALALAREKMKKLDLVERARERGALVVCDRYPQNEIMGFNDGPLLDGWRESPWRVLRALSRWERRPYDRAHANPPDVLVKLRVGEDVARARRPEMEVAELRRRIRALAELTFGEEVVTLVVDAEEPLETVLATVRRGVWEKL